MLSKSYIKQTKNHETKFENVKEHAGKASKIKMNEINYINKLS